MDRYSTYITNDSNAFKTDIYSKHGEDALLHFAFLYYESKLLFARKFHSADYRTFVNALYTAWVCQHEDLLHNENRLFSFDPEKLRADSFKMGYLRENYGNSEDLNGKILEIIGASEGRSLAYFIKEQIKKAKLKATRPNTETKFVPANSMIETPDYGMIFTMSKKDMPYRVEAALKYIKANGMPSYETLRKDYDWTQCILPTHCSMRDSRKVNENTKTIFSFQNAPERKFFTCAEAGLAADILLKKDVKRLASKYGEELLKEFVGEPANCFEEQVKINLNNILNELRTNLNNAIADAKKSCDQDCTTFNQVRRAQRDDEIKTLMEKFEADTEAVMKKMKMNFSAE